MRIVLVQKPDETAVLLNQAKSVDQSLVSNGFQKLMESVSSEGPSCEAYLTKCRIMRHS